MSKRSSGSSSSHHHHTPIKHKYDTHSDHYPYRIRAQCLQSPSQITSLKQTLTSPPSSSTTTTTTTKIIHFQRHAQAYHNLLWRVYNDLNLPIDLNHTTSPTLNPFLRPEIIDPPLTSHGRHQSQKRAVDVVRGHDGHDVIDPELIVVSPLRRTLETASLTFAHWRRGTDNIPPSIPWMANELCREEMGLLVCNKRNDICETALDFPHVDFSLVPPGDDERFNSTNRELRRDVEARVYSFLVDFIRTREEVEIVVVSHSTWLSGLVNGVLEWEEETTDEVTMKDFGVSEIRSMEVSFVRNGD